MKAQEIATSPSGLIHIPPAPAALYILPTWLRAIT